MNGDCVVYWPKAIILKPSPPVTSSYVPAHRAVTAGTRRRPGAIGKYVETAGQSKTRARLHGVCLNGKIKDTEENDDRGSDCGQKPPPSAPSSERLNTNGEPITSSPIRVFNRKILGDVFIDSLFVISKSPIMTMGFVMIGSKY